MIYRFGMQGLGEMPTANWIKAAILCAVSIPVIGAIAAFGDVLGQGLQNAAPRSGKPGHFAFATAVTPQGLENVWAVPVYGRGKFAFSLYGRDLPMGDGNAVDGAKVFATSCARCHNLRDGTTPAGKMANCWRYTKPLFNFVKRAMPASAPGSLNDDDIYAVIAYLLSEAKIVKRNAILTERSLPKVVMPNRDRFIPNFCPELSLYR